jgi:hypothetical protein
MSVQVFPDFADLAIADRHESVVLVVVDASVLQLAVGFSYRSKKRDASILFSSVLMRSFPPRGESTRETGKACSRTRAETPP